MKVITFLGDKFGLVIKSAAKIVKYAAEEIINLVSSEEEQKKEDDKSDTTKS